MSRVTERLFATDNVDETVAAQESAFPGASLRLSEAAEDFHYRMAFRGSLSVQHVTQQLPARFRADAGGLGFVTVAWAEQGEAEYVGAGERVRADGGVFWAGASPIAAEVAQVELHAVTIATRRFVERASALLGREFRLPERFVVLDGGARTRTARSSLEAAATLALDDAVADAPVVERAATDLLIARTLSMFGLDEASTARPVAPRTLKRALAYMEENVAGTVGAVDIAAAAGVSVRALQALFRRHLGRSPGEQMRVLRLDAARTDLLAGDPAHESTGAVARRYGFTNRGRFASSYRARFDESPRQTLER